ncbi:hypothetical protein GQ457_06G010600 [Hibiscus cannabinus]
MDYPVDRKVRAAVSLISGEALDWWESVVESVSAGRVTWDFFRKSFEDRYIGEEYYEKCRQDFLDLKQNNMTVNAYEMQFLSCSGMLVGWFLLKSRSVMHSGRDFVYLFGKGWRCIMI